MKIIQTQNVNGIEKILKKEGSSIVVFPEESFEDIEHKYLKEVSERFNSTLIGTFREKQLNLERALIVKNGKIYEAQFAFPIIGTQDTFTKMLLAQKTDKLYDVSPNQSSIKALIRISDDFNTEHLSEEKADLLIVLSLMNYMPYFHIENVRNNLKNDALIIKAIKGNQQESGIFNLNYIQKGIDKGNYKIHKTNH